VPVNPEEITLLLQQWRGGDRNAESRIYELVMPELRAIAGRSLRRERKNHTLQRTELVNEIFLKLYNSRIDWQSHGHFLAIVTRMMRRFLIDYARKRFKPILLPIDGLPEGLFAGRTALETVLAVDALMDELESVDPPAAQVLVLRWYLGLTTEETAKELGLSTRKVERKYHEGRKWLFERVNKKPCKAAQKTTSS
jgi:RNA polymerase sigma factor (TIGR02999 family)